jgi:hypothetical protein
LIEPLSSALAVVSLEHGSFNNKRGGYSANCVDYNFFILKRNSSPADEHLAALSVLEFLAQRKAFL